MIMCIVYMYKTTSNKLQTHFRINKYDIKRTYGMAHSHTYKIIIMPVVRSFHVVLLS